MTLPNANPTDTDVDYENSFSASFPHFQRRRLLMIGSLLLTWSAAQAATSELSYTFGAHYDSICLATASAAAVWRPDSDFDYFAQISPGIDGGKVSVGCGYALGGGIEGPTPSTWVDTMIIAAKLSYLYAWNPPSRLDSKRDFIGIEVEGGLLLSSSIGVFRAIDPGRSGSNWTAAWTLGVGL